MIVPAKEKYTKAKITETADNYFITWPFELNWSNFHPLLNIFSESSFDFKIYGSLSLCCYSIYWISSLTSSIKFSTIRTFLLTFLINLFKRLMPIAALINMTAENNPMTICIDPSHWVVMNAKYIALWSLEKYDWTKVEKMSCEIACSWYIIRILFLNLFHSIVYLLTMIK